MTLESLVKPIQPTLPSFQELLPPLDISNPVMIETKGLSVGYKKDKNKIHWAIRDLDLQIRCGQIEAIIGPSGCGKSSVLKAINMLLREDRKATVSGEVLFGGLNIYEKGVDVTQIRKSIGYLFQKANPFPKTIYENVAFGLKIHGYAKSELDDRVEDALKQADLWEEVKEDLLKKSGMELSGGQQQRLCIARAIAIEPEILLLDEPTSALDPVATQRVEETMLELKKTTPLAWVTHGMEQAFRVADRIAFFSVEDRNTFKEGDGGVLKEEGPVEKIRNNPDHPETRSFIAGEF